MDFYAIDVETSGCDPASICQIGIAGYENGALAYEWESLIKPDAYFSFDPFNIKIHGITGEMAANAPSLADVYPEIQSALGGSVVVCHTLFDRTAMARALRFYGLEPIECVWLDSARVARRTWRQFARKGYGLKNVCTFLGYEFRHHNALEDAKAAAQIILRACGKQNILAPVLAALSRPQGKR
jgi:DNA polymerase-3 subunit epsilon